MGLIKLLDDQKITYSPGVWIKASGTRAKIDITVKGTGNVSANVYVECVFHPTRSKKIADNVDMDIRRSTYGTLTISGQAPISANHIDISSPEVKGHYFRATLLDLVGTNASVTVTMDDDDS